jgi:hypothetical protein
MAFGKIHDMEVVSNASSVTGPRTPIEHDGKMVKEEHDGKTVKERSNKISKCEPRSLELTV